MTFSQTLWDLIEPQRKAIDDLPFLAQLQAGTLPREVFVGYLAQDTFYLNDYSRALAMVGSQAPDPGTATFWLTAAHNALVAEQELHAANVADLSVHAPSPTTTGYASYLLGQAATAGYEVAAAALLPCFWLYADVGTRLLERTGDLTGHPYGDWIGTYADPGFLQDAQQACRTVDTAGERTTPAVRERMTDAFVTATRWEWMFWDAAHRQETWPV